MYARLDCQSNLSTSITKLNPKSKLFVIREAPQTLLPKLFKAWRVTHLVFEKDTDAYARDRDDEVRILAKEAGVEIIVKTGRTLYDPDELVKENGGRPTMSISQVEKVIFSTACSHGRTNSPRQERRLGTLHGRSLHLVDYLTLGRQHYIVVTSNLALSQTSMRFSGMVRKVPIPS